MGPKLPLRHIEANIRAPWGSCTTALSISPNPELHFQAISPAESQWGREGENSVQATPSHRVSASVSAARQL